MSKFLRYMNEIVSLTVMLLMVGALVAGQADATIQDEVRAEADAEFSQFRFEDE
ncbi:MAG: hypothetical protein KJO95_12715 [Gammaproteobacteria bacterium]|nr:hypothetical protein [Gammaproteobacteria bacterium]MBU2678486.1 hypothetical protein [Gammaproteobacteria bacterium]NNC57318.1 hypothetical protein [Woeseiaceae bacterium]NNL52221.1 hypothetical protein [Woeseiaceae bacterium]